MIKNMKKVDNTIRHIMGGKELDNDTPVWTNETSLGRRFMEFHEQQVNISDKLVMVIGNFFVEGLLMRTELQRYICSKEATLVI